MIHPNMATMLCYLTTDVAATPAFLQQCLSELILDTFNMITVDGDTSTNDSVLLLANGLAGTAELGNGAPPEHERIFKAALREVIDPLRRGPLGRVGFVLRVLGDATTGERQTVPPIAFTEHIVRPTTRGWQSGSPTLSARRERERRGARGQSAGHRRLQGRAGHRSVRQTR